MVAETLLQYKIMEKLGEGGMGIVYLAEDPDKDLPDSIDTKTWLVKLKTLTIN